MFALLACKDVIERLCVVVVNGTTFIRRAGGMKHAMKLTNMDDKIFGTKASMLLNSSQRSGAKQLHLKNASLVGIHIVEKESIQLFNLVFRYV